MMKRNFNCLAVVRTTIWLAAVFAAPVLFGASADKRQAQAQLLDHAEFLCANCFFGASDYYYCFQADNRILVGYQKSPVLNYEDQTKNYLAPVRPSWAAWSAPGPTIPIVYDEKHIWVARAVTPPKRQNFWAHLKAFGFWASRANSKQVKLRRSSMRDIFIHNDQCRAADKSVSQ